MRILFLIIAFSGLIVAGHVLPPIDILPCITPLQQPGVCIPVKNCPHILFIIQNARRPLLDRIKQHLRNYQCSSDPIEPKVCCDFSIRVPSTTPTMVTTAVRYPNYRLRLINLNRYNLQKPIINQQIQVDVQKIVFPEDDQEDLQHVVPVEDLQHILTPGNVQQVNEEQNTTKSNEQSSDGQQYQDVMLHRNINLLPLNNCGIASSNKISNGNETELFQYPWMVRLMYDSSLGTLFKCSGSLINNRYVLTVAHCIMKNLTRVRLGEYNTETDIDCVKDPFSNDIICADKFLDVEIESINAHKDYNTSTHANDIALLRLKETINFSKSIQPICLPVTAAQQKTKLRKMIVSGWGRTELEMHSKVLLQAFVDYMPLEECQQRYNERKITLNSKQLCAIGASGVDSCRGDSGGPLINYGLYNTSDLRMIEYGIVSAGVPGCGHINSMPGIYTQVASYMLWILDGLNP